MRIRRDNRRKISIDLGLAAIEAVRPQGVRVTIEQIADICDCSTMAIKQIEWAALSKLRHSPIGQPLRDFATD